MGHASVIRKRKVIYYRSVAFKRTLVKVELVDFDDWILRAHEFLLLFQIVETTGMAAVDVCRIVSNATVLRAEERLALAPPRTLFHEVQFTVTDETTGFGIRRRETGTYWVFLDNRRYRRFFHCRRTRG